MTLFDLVAKLTLDSSEYEQGLEGARGKANKFAKGLNSAADKVLKVGAAAGGVAVAGMTAFAKSAVSTGQQFDAAMSQVAATMGVSVDSIQDLRDYAQKMGAETAFSANEAAQALNYMALAGYDAETSMQMLPNVLNLAAAGGMDLALASDMITDSQSALGLSLDETGKLVDKMAQAASKSNTSVSQLGDAILTVGGTAKNLKGGTTELATALGILADNGIKGAEGGTALRNILNSLMAPEEKAAKLMKKLGVSTFDSTGNMRSLNDVFLDLRGSLDSMSQEDRANVISTLFNARDMKSAEALIANVGDRWSELSGYIGEAQGAAQQMADTQLDNLAGDITLLKSAAEGAKIEFSEGISPAIRDVVQRITKALSRPKTQKFLKEVGQKLGEVIEKITKIVSKKVLPFLVGLFDDGAKKLKILIGVVSGAALAFKAITNPIGAAIGALGLLVGAFGLSALAAEEVDHTLEGLSDSERELVETARETAEDYSAAIDDYNEAVKKIDTDMSGVTRAWTELQGYVDENGNVIEGYEGRVSTLLGIINEGLGTQFELVDGQIAKYDEMIESVDKLIEKVKAELLLEANRDLYVQAEQAKRGASERLALASAGLETRTQELRDAQKAYDDFAKSAVAAGTAYETFEGNIVPVDPEAAATLERLGNAVTDATTALSDQKKEYKESSDQLDFYMAETQKWSDASTAIMEERYEDAQKLLTDDIAYKWKNLDETKALSKEELKELGRAYELKLEELNNYKQKFADGIYGYTEPELKELQDATDELARIYNAQVALARKGGEDVGNALGNGIAAGLTSITSVVAARGSALVGSTLHAMRETAMIASPSKVTTRYGQYLGEGLIKGLDATEDKAERAASDYMSSVLSPMNASADYAGNLIRRDETERSANEQVGGVMMEIRNLVREIRENLGFDVVLSDGTLAGRIDKLLGVRALQKARGN